MSKDERRKLDPKAKKFMFLGYGEETKGYRLYDSERNKVIFSRDVYFHETRKNNSLEPLEKQHSKAEKIVLQNDEDSEDNDEESEMLPEVQQGVQEPVVRRSQRIRRQPDRYAAGNVTIANKCFEEPSFYEEDISRSNCDNWKEAMEQEMKSLRGNHTWDLVELPRDRKTVGSKWIYKIKIKADGSIERYKARLVAQGYTQKFGVDYDETFCPVVRMESFRTILASAIQKDLKLHQIDVTTAFLNGELEEEVYMKQPQGFILEGQEKLVCRLNKSIYGLKQSPRCWNTALHRKLDDMGFVQSTSDPCVYKKDSGGDIFIIGVYVDDIVLAGKTDREIGEVKTALSASFDIKDLGKLHHFLGMNILHNDEKGEVWIGQPIYTENLLKKYGMENSNPAKIPMDPSETFMKSTDLDERFDQHLYQSAIGSLSYLSVTTRPDITYSVNKMAKFCVDPSKHHWTGVKHILRYLKGTIQHGITYTKQSSGECVAYSDADWGRDLDDRKSTSGYLFVISGGPVSWKSKKQSSVALSTAEAEYMALASSAQEAVWMRQLSSEMGIEYTKPVIIYEDNQSAIAMTKNPQFHGRTKHIAIKYHYIREQVNDGSITVQYCSTENMLADMLTKPLASTQFSKLCSLIGIKPSPKYIFQK